MDRVMDRSLRKAFDVPAAVAFCNTANIGPRHLGVRAAETYAMDRWAQPWHLTANDWFRDTERLRGLAAALFHATADDIAIVPSVSYAMAVAVRNIAVSSGQNIVVLDQEFPSKLLRVGFVRPRSGGGAQDRSSGA